MQNGWLIYDTEGIKRNKWFADEMIRCADRLDCRLSLKVTDTLKYGYTDGALRFFENGMRAELPDYAIVRTIDPLLSSQLEMSGVRVFNSAYTSMICNDKRLTHLTLAKTNIPMTDTLFCDKRYFSAENITYPCICKSASGHGGKEVFMVNDTKELICAIDRMAQNEFLIQKPASDLGIDVRVYVLGERVIMCAKRSSEYDFRSNFSLGGNASVTDNEKIKEYAVKAARCVKADLVGVDFIYDNGEPLLNEIEDVVGTRMIYSMSDIDICSLYSEYIKECLNNENNK